MRSRSAGGTGIEHVRGRQKEDFGEVERHVEVVIAKRIVLFGIEHFEQRRRRVAAEIRAELVDLVQDEHRVLRLGAAQPLNDLARQRADVGAPMAADLGLVAHAAERHAHELAAERIGDGLGERRLADARRAEKAEDRSLDVRIQLAHRQILEHAVLHLLEAGVVGVEHVFRALEIDRILGALRPRERDDPVEIRARDGVLRRRHRHLGEPVELAQRFLPDRVGQPGGVKLFPQLVDLLGLLVTFAELLLDRLHLLAQEVLALVLADFGLHLRLDLRAELEDLELLDEQTVERVHPGADIERLEHLLLDRGPDRRQARGDEVGELARIGDVAGERLEIVGQERRERDDLLEVALDVALQGVDFEVIFVAEEFVGERHRGAKVRPGLQHLVEPHARQALNDQPQAAVRQLEHLVDVGGRADRVEVLLQGLLDGRFALREDADHPARRARFVDQSDRRFARHGQRHEGIGKQHRVAERQHRHVVGNRQPFRGRRLFDDDGFVTVAHR